MKKKEMGQARLTTRRRLTEQPQEGIGVFKMALFCKGNIIITNL